MEYTYHVPSELDSLFLIKNMEELRAVCYQRAKEVYGNPLPEEVDARLSYEMACIYADEDLTRIFTYAMRVADYGKSQGLRTYAKGVVSASLAAYFAGFTNVNPLPAHHYCPVCKRLEFVRLDHRLAPCDLPPKICPTCGAEMKRDGYDIPVETCFGLNGDKRPDILLRTSVAVKNAIAQQLEQLNGELDVAVDPLIDELDRLEKSTGVKCCEIPLSEPQMIQLFRSDPGHVDDKALPPIINAVDPQCFSDLLKCFEFAHCLTDSGFDSINALLKPGIPLHDRISTREDVMEYLIRHGATRKDAFLLAEAVRKGWAQYWNEENDAYQQMKKYHIPDWYMELCKDLHYLGSRAYSVVDAQFFAQRLWYKLHFPAASRNAL